MFDYNVDAAGRTNLYYVQTADFGRTWALETLPITTHEGSGPQSVVFLDARRGMVLAGGAAVLCDQVMGVQQQVDMAVDVANGKQALFSFFSLITNSHDSLKMSS